MYSTAGMQYAVNICFTYNFELKAEFGKIGTRYWLIISTEHLCWQAGLFRCLCFNDAGLLACRGHKQVLDLQGLVHDTSMLRNSHLDTDAGNHLSHFSHGLYSSTFVFFSKFDICPI